MSDFDKYLRKVGDKGLSYEDRRRHYARFVNDTANNAMGINENSNKYGDIVENKTGRRDCEACKYRSASPFRRPCLFCTLDGQYYRP